MLCGSLLELGSFLFMNDLETNVKLIKKHEKEANVQWPSKTWKTVAETILIKTNSLATWKQNTKKWGEAWDFSTILKFPKLPCTADVIH